MPSGHDIVFEPFPSTVTHSSDPRPQLGGKTSKLSFRFPAAGADGSISRLLSVSETLPFPSTFSLNLPDLHTSDAISLKT